MDKACKIICIVAAAALGVGIVFAGIGYFFGGANVIALEKPGFKVIDKDDKNEMDIIDETYTDVKNIKVDVSYFNKVILREGDSFSVKGKNPKHLGGLQANLSAGTLAVTDAKRGKDSIFNFGFITPFGINTFGRFDQEDLIITYPSGSTLGAIELNIDTAKLEVSKLTADRIEATLNLGDTSIGDITCKTLIINTDTGDVSINNVKCDSITMDLDLGKCEIDGIVTEKAILKSDTGDIDITDIESNGSEIDCNLGDLTVKGKLLGKSTIKMDTGTINLDLRQSRDETSYFIETDLGSVNVNGNKSSGSVENRIPGAANTLNINSDLGDVKVSFN